MGTGKTNRGERDPGLRSFILADDGTIPNNALPVLVYSGVQLPAGDPAAGFERCFEANGWGGTWRNGVYDFHHYHSTAHEALGIAAGEAVLQLGGPSGPTLEVRAGHCIVLPAGTGHMRIRAGRGFLVVGAYPAGQAPDLCRGRAGERPAADRRIAAVGMPARDPVHGAGGPLERLWTVRGLRGGARPRPAD